MKTSYFSKCWKTGFIVPIFKSGESSHPGNYRGITINCFGKLFTLIINERLLELLNHKRTINACQIGFRKGYKTADHVFVRNTIIIIIITIITIIIVISRKVKSVCLLCRLLKSF